MLTCKEVADRASALIDGELSTWDAFQIHLHLAMCQGCGRFIAQMRTTDTLIAQIADLKDPLAQHDSDDGRYADILSTLRNKKPRR